MKTYRPNEFAKLIAKTTSTLQRWDTEFPVAAKKTIEPHGKKRLPIFAGRLASLSTKPSRKQAVDLT